MKTMDVNVDDMLVKSKLPEDHIKHLGQMFKILRKYPNEAKSLEVYIWGRFRKVSLLHG